MPANMACHPSSDELHLFGQGRLPPARQQEVERHIETCDTCCDALRSVPDDTLLGRLRAGETLEPAADDRTSVSATDAIPVELRDHPRYRIVKRLGAGGMGVVYKAEHRMMERPVALKVINRRLIKNQLALDRFRVEVKAAARLSHPHIVTAYDADQAGELQILVMEFVEGISVARQVEKAGPMPVRFACQFARQAALGLQHAHEKGMVHRDIKPHNLMLTRDGRVKILDFGLARFARESEPAETISLAEADVKAEGGLTQDGTALGTPDYMAPEQIRDARTADIRADIYGLGCTLYFMLAGHSPFPHGTSTDKLLAHLEHEPADLAIVRPEAPAGLIAIVNRMLAKRPADRYATPAEVAVALAPFVRADSRAPAEAPPQRVESHPVDWSAIAETAEFAASLTPLHAAASRPDLRNTVVALARRHRIAFAAFVFLLVVAGLGMVANRVRPQTPSKAAAARPNENDGRSLARFPTTEQRSSQPRPQSPSTAVSSLRKRLLLVVPHEDFWPPDVYGVQRAAEEIGVKVHIASSLVTPARPSPFGPATKPLTIDVLLENANAADYDTVIFSGANPVDSFEHLRDERYAETERQFVQAIHMQGKPVASICLGSRVLADLGFLKNKQAARCGYQPKTAEYESSAIWTGRAVQTDLPFITASDANTAKKLIQEIVTALAKTPQR